MTMHEHEQDLDRDRLNPRPGRSVDAPGAPGRASKSASLQGPSTPLASGIVAPSEREPRPENVGALVQFSSSGRDPSAASSTGAIQDTAAKGVEGAGSPLPHLDQIQTSFGRHDVTSVQAHVGAAAASANAQMGSEAYATGSKVAFSGAPSLHTAAHEAAHVVQQRAGIDVADGVGQEGDEHERHADEVADAVVQGKSAEGLLDMVAGGQDHALEQLLVQYKRPAPVEVDAGAANAVEAEIMAGKAFGQMDWKKEVDWAGLKQFMGTVTTYEQRLTSTVNPFMDQALEHVEQIRDDFKVRLNAAFEKELPKIKQIVTTDTDVRRDVEQIRVTGESIKNKFDEKAAALADVDASANEMTAAAANAQKIAAEKDKDKKSGDLAGVQASRDKALADLMAIPDLIKGAIDLGKDIAKDGPAAVAAGKAKGIANDLVMSAYKGWAEKVVADKYDVTIKNLQSKIRTLQTQIQQLQDKDAASRVAAAAGRGKAAAIRVQAADKEIANLAKHVVATRKTLMITIQQKYKDISVFKLSHEATEAMRQPLADYLMALNQSKLCLAQLQPWQQYYTQLSGISMKAQGLDYLNGGELPKLGAPKRTAADEAKMQRIVQQIQQFTGWLSKLGSYVETENAFVDSEIEKVQSGGYLDFVHEIEGKIVGML
ncbi:MAG TPA: DUF4157 domain-containing protein, partial [Kofleriaceae bacterium]|nr:DUF4157 domain-containing protein [Kofleriaceae bacterium]